MIKWFKPPIKLNDREQYIFNIIELMLNKEDSEVRIDPDKIFFFNFLFYFDIYN